MDKIQFPGYDKINAGQHWDKNQTHVQHRDNIIISDQDRTIKNKIDLGLG